MSTDVITTHTDAHKPLSGRVKLTQMTVVFKHLTEEMQEGVPPEYNPGSAARIALYRHIQGIVETRQAEIRVAVKNTVTFDIPVFYLSREDSYQREQVVSPNQLAYLVSEWNEYGFRALRVAALPIYNDAGTMVDVEFQVADGWNRRCALIERMFNQGIVDFDIPCEVSLTETTKDGAFMFWANNSADGGKQVASLEAWRAGYKAERPDIVRVVELAAEYGLDASFANRSRDWPYLPLGPALRSMMMTPNVGEQVVRRVLTFYANEQLFGLRGTRVKDTPYPLSSQFCIGLCQTVAIWERAGIMHHEALEAMLSDVAFLPLFGIYFRSLSPENVKSIIGKNICRQNDEKQRYWKVASSLFKLYGDYVTAPNTRKRSRWEDCPRDIKQLFHVTRKIRDEDERRAEVAKLHSALIRQGHEPYFVIRADRRITRK